jgi:hypothetical protein
MEIHNQNNTKTRTIGYSSEIISDLSNLYRAGTQKIHQSPNTKNLELQAKNNTEEITPESNTNYDSSLAKTIFEKSNISIPKYILDQLGENYGVDFGHAPEVVGFVNHCRTIGVITPEGGFSTLIAKRLGIDGFRTQEQLAKANDAISEFNKKIILAEIEEDRVNEPVTIKSQVVNFVETNSNIGELSCYGLAGCVVPLLVLRHLANQNATPKHQKFTTIIDTGDLGEGADVIPKQDTNPDSVDDFEIEAYYLGTEDYEAIVESWNPRNTFGEWKKSSVDKITPAHNRLDYSPKTLAEDECVYNKK